MTQRTGLDPIGQGEDTVSLGIRGMPLKDPREKGGWAQQLFCGGIPKTVGAIASRVMKTEQWKDNGRPDFPGFDVTRGMSPRCLFVCLFLAPLSLLS